MKTLFSNKLFTVNKCEKDVGFVEFCNPNTNMSKIVY
jgi:hypothetical protein